MASDCRPGAGQEDVEAEAQGERLVMEDVDASSLDLEGEAPGLVRIGALEDVCYEKGLRPGDRLVMVGGQAVQDLDHDRLQAMLQLGPVRLEVQRSKIRGALRVLAGLQRWTQKAKQAAVSQMAQEETAMRHVQTTQVKEDWTDGVPEPEKRVFPRPNPIRYKWILRTCFEHDWKFIRRLSQGTLQTQLRS